MAHMIAKFYRSISWPPGVRSGLRYLSHRLVLDQSFLDLVNMWGDFVLNFTTSRENFYTWLPTFRPFPEPQRDLVISEGFTVTPFVIGRLIFYFGLVRGCFLDPLMGLFVAIY